MTKENLERESAEEAYAYTPGLKVKKGINLAKTRLLPIQGKTQVEKGDTVDFDTIVASTNVPGKPIIVRISDILNVKPEDIPVFMIKKVGDEVEEGEIIGKYTPFWGLFKKLAMSPTKGVIEAISDITGQIIVREPSTPVEIKAYIPGKIANVIPQVGVVVESYGVYIQGIFGIGGEQHGELLTVVDSPKEKLTADKIKPEHKRKILVGGSLVTLDALRKAQDIGVKGIIVGGLKGTEISEFLGYEIGVAITGHEDIDLSLVVTEGFGAMNMSSRVYNLLKEYEGYQAAINGATQIRAGVIRPEIFIPHSNIFQEISEEITGGMKQGTLVRIIREPYFGKIGTVISLPVQLQKIETTSEVRVVEVELDEGKLIVPRANVEIIEE